MAIVFACPKCQKKYQVDDKYAGKQIKCQGCGSPIPVPVPGAKPAAPQAGQKAAAPKGPASKSPVQQEVAPAAANLGLDSIVRESDLFGGQAQGAASANLFDDQPMQDFGIAAAPEPLKIEKPADTGPRYAENQALKDFKKVHDAESRKAAREANKGKSKGKAGGSGGSSNPLTQPWLIVLIAGLVVGIFAGVVGLISPMGGVIIAAIGFCLLQLAGIGAVIWYFVILSRVGTVVDIVLSLLFGPYMLVMVIKHWADLKGQFFLNLVCGVFAFLLMMEVVVFAPSAFPNIESPDDEIEEFANP